LSRRERLQDFRTVRGRRDYPAAIETEGDFIDALRNRDLKIKSSGLDLSYDNQWGRYRVSLDRDGLKQHRGLIKELVGNAFQDAKSA
jgi:hypothetical protein